MKFFSSLITALAVGLVPSTLGQIISYTPSNGKGVSYSVNVPEDTASSGSGPIFLQLTAPSDLKWIALGQGSHMTHGHLFVVYSASEDNVTLSPRKARQHYEPLYNPEIEASLLEGSGISNGIMTANVRCDNCMYLSSGKSILGRSSPWIWAITGGGGLDSANVSQRLYKHDWHGLFTLDLTQATGGDAENPFSTNTSYSVVDYTPHSKQQQINDTILHRKRIAHGVMTSVAFVLLFPNFGLLLYIFPSRYTVAWIHAPLQVFAVCLAIAGSGVGVSVAEDIQDVGGYHPVLGYVALIGVVLFQPILGIMQHIRWRQMAKKTMWGLSHRYLGRFLSVLGIINGGIGFHYASTKNPDIPDSSRYSYGIIAGSMGIIYVLVIWWRLNKDKRATLQSQGKLTSDQESDSSSRTACQDVENRNTCNDSKAWVP